MPNRDNQNESSVAKVQDFRLGEGQHAKVIEAIRKAADITYVECSFCGNEEFNEFEAYVVGLVSPDGGQLIQGAFFPMFPLTCKRCGHTELFSLGMLQNFFPKPIVEVERPKIVLAKG